MTDETGWQPIASAPRDGTEMLLWSPLWEHSWGIVLGHFDSEGGQWATSEGECDENEPDFDPNAEMTAEEAELMLPEDWDENMGPTHWFALPQPPQGSTP